MNVSNLEILTRNSAIWSINSYQKYISPKKGFACPHRLLHGGLSCSDYVKNRLLNQNLFDVLQMSVQRGRECALASKHLQAESSGGCIVIPCCIPL